ncbi:MAG: hypothetical protein QXF52_05490 [Thermoproteota archaeon]
MRGSDCTTSRALCLRVFLTLVLPVFKVKGSPDGIRFQLIRVKIREESDEETSQTTRGG